VRSSGPAACTRCKAPLNSAANLPEALPRVSDCGVQLDAFDKSAGKVLLTVKAPAPRIDEGHDSQLRRWQRKLQARRFEAGESAHWLSRVGTAADAGLGPHGFAAMEELTPLRTTFARREPAAWGASTLLALGAVAVACGFLLLVIANMLLHAPAWRWGFAIATGGETLIIAGLTGMAFRLWRNSRRLNLQLDGIDRRLEVVQSTLVQGATAPSRRSGSLLRTSPL
jgi:hypothetical protein